MSLPESNPSSASLFQFRRVAAHVPEYGHYFGWWRLRCLVTGAATYDDARRHLPLRFLPWELLDAGHHLADQNPRKQWCDHNCDLAFDGEEWYCPDCHAEALEQEDWDACHRPEWAIE